MENTNIQYIPIPAEEEEGSINLHDILDIFVIHWKWFAISVILCGALGFLYLSTKPNIYKRHAVMLVKDEQSQGGGSRSRMGLDALMQLNGVVMGSNVKNEVYILQSHQLVKEVVRRLHLDVYYHCRRGLQNISLYDVKPFTALFDSTEVTHPYAFKVKLDGDQVTITDLIYGKEDWDIHIQARLGQAIQMPFGTLTLQPDPSCLQAFDGRTIHVTRLTIDEAAFGYGAPLNTSEMDKQSSLVALSYSDTNIRRAEDILTTILAAYKESIINDKNLVAQSTADFIDERLRLIDHELSEVEGQMARFKAENKILDFKTNVSTYAQEGAETRRKSVEMESQVLMTQYLITTLKDNAKPGSLIPTLGSIVDAGIQSQIVEYNRIMLERNRLVTNASESAARIQDLDKNLDQMRAAIVASAESYLSTLNIQLQQARKEEQYLLGNISSVPQKEQQAMDIQRQQEIKNTLYTYLLNKREETALQLAITEANIRIVEAPFGKDIPISPKRRVIMLIALGVGFILPFLFFFLRSILNMSVRGRKDIEQATTIPILGEIPHLKDSDIAIAISEDRKDPVNEAFRMLRFNLNFSHKDARVVMFTSTTPSEGKSFVSRNLCSVLNLSGKKVILVDTDLRKSTQSHLLTKKKAKYGITSFLSQASDNLDELIIRAHDAQSFDLLPVGIVPPNPSELLMSDRLEECVRRLKEHYDYVIIDNVPAQAVADACIVGRVADITLYVIREGKVDRRYLTELERLKQENLFPNLNIVLNDTKFTKRSYGYGYGYGYGNEK